MTVPVLVPYRPDGGHRDRLWRFVRTWFWGVPPVSCDYTVVVGRSPDGPFNRAAAVNAAAAAAGDWDVAVIADADTWVPGAQLDSAVRLARQTGRLAAAFTAVIELDEASTEVLVGGELAHIPISAVVNLGIRRVRVEPLVTQSSMLAVPRALWDRIGGFDEGFVGWGCCDSETEILTRTGWKRYDEVSVGDLVLTLNHHTGESEWQPIRKMTIHNTTCEMLSVNTRTHSSMTTLDHRWPVLGRNGERGWRTSSTIDPHDRVPISARNADIPTEATLSDALVEAVAWFYTEGRVSDTGRRGTITQKDPENCARIASALERLFGPPSDDFERRGRTSRIYAPRWRQRRVRDWTVFDLNPEATETLLEHAPGKVPSHDFLLSLTRHQLDLFLESSVLADGHRAKPRGNRRGGTVFEQKNPAAAEAFAFAAILAGHGVSVRTRGTPTKGDRSSGSPREPGYSMTVVTLRSRDRIALNAPNGAVPEVVSYTGVFWCPTTDNSTWMARRDGKVYFTGNCEDNAFWKAATILGGQPLRVDGAAFHLWHHEQDQIARLMDPLWRANWARWCRYRDEAVCECTLRRVQQS